MDRKTKLLILLFLFSCIYCWKDNSLKSIEECRIFEKIKFKDKYEHIIPFGDRYIYFNAANNSIIIYSDCPDVYVREYAIENSLFVEVSSTTMTKDLIKLKQKFPIIYGIPNKYNYQKEEIIFRKYYKGKLLSYNTISFPNKIEKLIIFTSYDNECGYITLYRSKDLVLFKKIGTYNNYPESEEAGYDYDETYGLGGSVVYDLDSDGVKEFILIDYMLGGICQGGDKILFYKIKEKFIEKLEDKQWLIIFIMLTNSARNKSFLRRKVSYSEPDKNGLIKEINY